MLIPMVLPRSSHGAHGRAKVKKEYKHLRGLYTTRKRTTMDILAQMSEGQGKRVSELIEEIRLETDEEYGVAKDTFPVLS